MGLPEINITFKTLAATAMQRSQKGVVAVILKDNGVQGGISLTDVTDIPAGLSEKNKGYLQRTFVGYINPPRKVLAFCYDGTDGTLTDALSHFETQQFDYLAGAPDQSAEDAGTIAAWIKSQRQNHHMVKAVLPNQSSDSEGIVNFTGTGMTDGAATFTAAEYCSRIAGLIAGTPMTISCTYAPLPELTDVTRLTDEELDAKVEAGELVLKHDGEKVKIGRGVNSFVTTTQDKGEAFQKIKIVEAVDMIQSDIRRTVEDSYIGKYANSYDNKCLLIMAIKGYLEGLELDGILETATSRVEIDLKKQENYLKSTGVDTEGMSEQEIKQAGTGSKVFLKASVQILDAIEDVELAFTI